MYDPQMPAPSSALSAQDRSSVQGMVRVLQLQVLMVLVVAVISGLIAGKAGFWSAFAGGFVYIVPCAVTIGILVASVRMGVVANPFTFFMLEGFRLGMALLLLGVIGYVYRHVLVWPALLIGLIVALKAFWVLVVLKKV